MKQAIIFLVFAATSVVLKAGDQSKCFSIEQGELLARTAAEPSGVTKLGGFSLERETMKQFPDFYFYDALVSEPGAEGFSGHYAVNKFTGEVWDPQRCSRFSDPDLSKLQRNMRKELGLSAKAYRQHRKSDPCL